MGASNFGKTNLPSGIIYMFATQEEANNLFDLLLTDEAGEGYTEDDRQMFVEMECQDNYRETIINLRDILPIREYPNIEMKGDKKILGYIPETLFNKESRQWESVSINILVEHGYHDGARFDIDLDDLYDNFPTLNKSQQKIIDKEVRGIEEAFAKVCQVKMKKVGSFSNGEGIYENIS